LNDFKPDLTSLLLQGILKEDPADQGAMKRLICLRKAAGDLAGATKVSCLASLASLASLACLGCPAAVTPVSSVPSLAARPKFPCIHCLFSFSFDALL
jgi:hypothetical protein